eukprot:scaffold398996_cov33-Prasinocladus_malaysianus.AAC.1
MQLSSCSSRPSAKITGCQISTKSIIGRMSSVQKQEQLTSIQRLYDKLGVTSIDEEIRQMWTINSDTSPLA